MKSIRMTFMVIFTLMLPTISHADWASDYFNDMKNNSVLRQSATIQAQGSTTYSGGGWTWEGGNATLQPFQVKAPSISAGCSGISFDFGAFSYLAEEEKLSYIKYTFYTKLLNSDLINVEYMIKKKLN